MSIRVELLLRVGVAVGSIIFTALAVAPHAAAQPVEWPVSQGGKGHYYEYVPEPGMSWTASRAAAAARPAPLPGMNAYLASIACQGENDFVDTLRPPARPSAWFNLTDEDLEGTFVTKTGEGYTFTNWAIGEPNAFFPSEDYGIIFQSGKWTDATDSFPSDGYLVEYSFSLVYEFSPSDARPGNGHFYRPLVFSATDATWTDANANANASGFCNNTGHLLTATSPGETAFAQQILGDLGQWIGFTDAGQEGAFAWVTGEPDFEVPSSLQPNPPGCRPPTRLADADRWAQGGPSDPSGNEDYVAILPGGRWTDRANSDVLVPGRRNGWVVEFEGVRYPKIEVTQAVQDLRNTVPLAAFKRTFVRLHVASGTGPYQSSAELELEWTPPGGTANTLTIRPRRDITVKPFPDRSRLDDAFLFDLPTPFTAAGQLRIAASLLPAGGPRLGGVASTSVQFDFVPAVLVINHRVEYTAGGLKYLASETESNLLKSWLERAFPMSEFYWQDRVFSDPRFTPDMGSGFNCVNLNAMLNVRWLSDLNRVFLGATAANRKYYGMVTNRGGSFGGCFSGVPASSGDAGTPLGARDWDTDGTYGDWIGAHEVAHSFGRPHAPCNNAGGPDPCYPYASLNPGRPPTEPGAGISPAVGGEAAMYGFDVMGPAIYPPGPYGSNPTLAGWTDLMGYCQKQWVGGSTYRALKDAFQGTQGQGGGQGEEPPCGGEPRLLVQTHLDPVTLELTYDTVLVIPDPCVVPPPEPGPVDLVLRNERGEEVARHSVMPSEVQDGPAGLMSISAVVPAPLGITQVDIIGEKSLAAVAGDGQGAGGQVLGSFRSGPNPPSVQVLRPNGGEAVVGGPLDVQWEGSDPDGDEVRYYIQYAPDGSAYETLAVGLTGNQFEIPAVNLRAGGAARIRVIASDGFHNGIDESDGSFTVLNHPPTAEILEPAADIVVALAQTVAFTARAYDIDIGSLSDELSWSSDRDGLLGTGAYFSTAGLTLGVHTVLLTADDGAAQATDSVQVTVVADIAGIPPVPDELIVRPQAVSFAPANGVASEILSVENRNAANPIPWSAQSTEPWIEVDPQGMTPSGLGIRFADTGLAPGTYGGNVFVTSATVPAQMVAIQVEVVVAPLPVLFVRADANDDGKLDLSDPISTLGCLFLGLVCSDCNDALDANDDNEVDISDVIYSLSFLFLGGRRPLSPFPACGFDPTGDALPACSFKHCP